MNQEKFTQSVNSEKFICTNQVGDNDFFSSSAAEAPFRMFYRTCVKRLA